MICCLTVKLYSIQLDYCWILYFNKIARLYIFLKISPLVSFLSYKNILISNSFYGENSSFLWEICGLPGSLLEIPCVNYFIIISCAFFLYFFLNQCPPFFFFFFFFFFFAFWCKKIRSPLVTGFLLLVVFCKV